MQSSEDNNVDSTHSTVEENIVASTHSTIEETNVDSIVEEYKSKDTKALKKHTVKQKLFQLPLSRVKEIMKMDPDCNIILKDAVFVTTKATCLGKEMSKYTQMAKRKIILKQDFDNAVDSTCSLCFLEGSLE